MGNITKVKDPKLGELKLTETQKEQLAELVESDGWKVLKSIIRPQRQVKYALLTINSAPDTDTVSFYRGASWNNDDLVKSVERVAEEFNKTNGDNTDEA